jgi:hypothetical protein
MVSMRQTGPMKAATAGGIRRTAQLVDHHHPETVTGGHLRDAARMLQAGHTDAAKRHLDAAMEVLTPRNLIRHGITDDEGHATAKHHMHQIHRMRLQVQDIEDVRARNENLRERARQTAAAGRDGTGRGVNDTGTRPVPPQLQVARTYSSWADVDSAIELAFGWKTEPRLPTGEWASVHGGASARALHGKMVHGLTGKGEIVTGIYNHNSGQVIARHSGAIPVVRIKPATHPAPVPHQPYSRSPFKAYSSLANELELAFPAMAWEHETRDPHTGKWSAGPATLENIRTHLENAHGFGHSFPDQSNEHLLARHAQLHRQMPFAQNHHHIVSGGGADSAYGRMRAARDVQAALSAPAFTPGQRGRMGLTGPERIARGRVKGAPHSMGYSSWEEVSQAVELSARTGMLAVTPAPRGRPGGPGLYHQKGLGHTSYFQQVVKALIEKRGMAPDKAYAVAYGALRKWRRGGGGVHPEVQAAAGGALAGEAAKAASAHAHTADPAAAVIELFNPYHAPTGKFTTASGAGQAQGKQPGAGKGMAGKTAGSRARLVQRAKLQKRAHAIHAQILALLAMLPQHHAASHKSVTPRKKGATAASAKAAAARKAASSKAKRASSTTAHKMSPATIHAKINALRAELAAIRAQIKAL